MFLCKNCQKEVPQTPQKRPREYCGSTCRSNYWQKQNRSEKKKDLSDKKVDLSEKKIPIGEEKKAIPEPKKQTHESGTLTFLQRRQMAAMGLKIDKK